MARATGHRLRRGRAAGGLAAWLAAGLLAFAAAAAPAGDLTIRVTDPAGRPVASVVVVVTPRNGPAPRTGTATTAVLDQRDRAFVPQVLVVRTGTEIAFPNSDTVSHQVYSFSPAKRFQLPLYKGRAHAPLRFDQPGLVVLGCNIHDEMIGYVYVTDSAWYAVTDANGTALVGGVPAGPAGLEFWGPRVADPPATLTRSTVIGAGAGSFELRLARPLRPRPEPRPQDPAWDY